MYNLVLFLLDIDTARPCRSFILASFLRGRTTISILYDDGLFFIRIVELSFSNEKELCPYKYLNIFLIIVSFLIIGSFALS